MDLGQGFHAAQDLGNHVCQALNGGQSLVMGFRAGDGNLKVECFCKKIDYGAEMSHPNRTDGDFKPVQSPFGRLWPE